MNLGWKYCYINQQPDVLRYVADLRLNQKFRGQNILRLLMDYLRDELPQDSMLESIILVDNLPARRIFHETKTGFPSPYFYDDIQTFTVSQVQKPAAFVANSWSFYLTNVIGRGYLPLLEKIELKKL